MLRNLTEKTQSRQSIYLKSARSTLLRQVSVGAWLILVVELETFVDTYHSSLLLSEAERSIQWCIPSTAFSSLQFFDVRNLL